MLSATELVLRLSMVGLPDTTTVPHTTTSTTIPASDTETIPPDSQFNMNWWLLSLPGVFGIGMVAMVVMRAKRS
ncbi:MAG: hypothetical protein FWF18_06035 [Dehalococcoidia bacterium]|nr:hypothetical protein [Dehalococcoidia bacterium]